MVTMTEQDEPLRPDEPEAARDSADPEAVHDAAEREPDWAAYYRHTLGRDARPLFARGIDALVAADVQPEQAVEVGFGDGTETLMLLGAGFRVLAIDSADAAADLLRPRVPARDADRLEIRIAPAEAVDLPPFDLLYSGYVLSFLAPEAFRRFWVGVRAHLRPGGFIVANIFGVHDTWATERDMTFVDLDGLHRLLDGLEVLEIREEDQDGDSFSGPKHWHLFDVIARRPPERP
jgi:precorrin-6B methylase 2